MIIVKRSHYNLCLLHACNWYSITKCFINSFLPHLDVLIYPTSHQVRFDMKSFYNMCAWSGELHMNWNSCVGHSAILFWGHIRCQAINLALLSKYCLVGEFMLLLCSQKLFFQRLRFCCCTPGISVSFSFQSVINLFGIWFGLFLYHINDCRLLMPNVFL